MNLTVPEEFVNNPSKVAKLFEKKWSLEKELQTGEVVIKSNPPSQPQLRLSNSPPQYIQLIMLSNGQ